MLSPLEGSIFPSFVYCWEYSRNMSEAWALPFSSKYRWLKKKKGEIKLQEKKIYTDKGEKEVYRSSPCLWHQLSCCIPLCPLFVEPRVGKAQAKRLERDSRSRRNFRQVYSLLVGTAAITQPLSRLAQRTYCSSLLSWLTQWTQPWDSSNFPYFMAGAHIDTAHNSWPTEYLMTRMCGAINDFSCYTVVIYKMWGRRAWTHHLGQFALSPHSTPSGSLAHVLCAVHLWYSFGQ